MPEKIKNILALFKSSKALNLATLLLIVAAVPLTVFIAQKQQETRQRAAGPITSPVLSPTFAFENNVNILVVKFFPLDSSGVKLDQTISGSELTLSAVRQKVNYLNQQAMDSLTKGSKYHGYKDLQTAASLNYSILDTKEYLEPIPISNNKVPWHANDPSPTYRPDYYSVMLKLNICDYVDNKNVSQVWFWGYHYGKIEPVEADQSMGITSKAFWNHGTYGNISNSEQINDLPTCKKTYTLYNYNYDRGLGEMLEDHGHQIESVLSFVDPNLWAKLRDPHGLSTGINNCGWTHSPPNVTDANQYLWNSETTVQSQCEDWKPDGTGAVKEVNCHTWYGATCLDNGGVEFKVWWMQNIPGFNNNLIYQGKPLRNWWEFYKDFDTALAKGKTLFSDQLNPTPTPFVCTACSADINKNGTVDTFDFTNVNDCKNKTLNDKDRYGKSCALADINKDGNINNIDYSCIQSKLGQKCSALSPTLTPINSPTPTPIPTKGLVK